ncbi:hypothetical protein COM99_26450 [Bacillus cereus]|uniref:hypothetical protein n=1 Tax=Bacillus cereus group TaxID=86661 RepID=UPI000BED639D|nr:MULTISPECIES: hypothetical protein [Bacillus cereus group]MDF3554658.1 hypothetical protein [Bacillus cereus]PEC30700.1 hypothetical protein COM99_26450 [Bacillus cereus]PEY41084.1 hypothetical protein CN347_01870 [Bacillus cereus]PFJ73689.1 hypothetical protein COJ08_24110 [Bacillus cereus]PFP18922.1 hypothetical protein COJ94_29065 [Bacillus cereus]
MEKELKSFFKVIKELRESNIIRSDRYLGDIGEHMCQELYGLELNKSGREKGYDGVLNNKKYEVKFHNSLKRTNIYLGNPDIYDILLIVLGPESILRPKSEKDSFLIYKIESEYIKKSFKQKSGFCCGKRYFSQSNPDKTYNLL